jgi:hypothetical protein
MILSNGFSPLERGRVQERSGGYRRTPEVEVGPEKFYPLGKYEADCTCPRTYWTGQSTNKEISEMQIMMMNSIGNGNDDAAVQRGAKQQLATKQGNGPFSVKVDLSDRIVMCNAVKSGSDWKVTIVKITKTTR